MDLNQLTNKFLALVNLTIHCTQGDYCAVGSPSTSPQRCPYRKLRVQTYANSESVYFVWSRTTVGSHADVTHGLRTEFHPDIEETQIDDSEIYEDCNIVSSDRGNFGDSSTE
ncbi:hypothetical protein EVAR_28138_1 [Eumeta japonica]|uniref:Uncharacterized protein n=1 Tax=Eumeta variegata TaxID=151549 RepID=A0A4C1VEX6_EUMVA|nr:hypothetical protein EVAR_28138_1 [Eumeta japonica]